MMFLWFISKHLGDENVSHMENIFVEDRPQSVSLLNESKVKVFF